MAEIKIKVTGHKAEKLAEDWLSTGSAGVDFVILEADQSWAGFNLAAAFKVGDAVYYSVFAGQSAPIPAAALSAKFFQVGIYGTKEGPDGTELRTTGNYIPVRPKAGPGADGTTPPEPSESLYNQILEIAQHAENTAEAVAAAAAAGDFDGDPGPQGPQGDPGPQGETGPQGPKGEPGEVTAAQLSAGLNTKADAIEVASVMGTGGAIQVASNMPLADLTLYGQTTQSGTPSPASPAAIVSVPATIQLTDGTNTQTATAPELRGLISANTNYYTYTDGINNRWYGDSLQLSTGQILRRIIARTFTGAEGESWGYLATTRVFYIALGTPLATSTAVYALNSQFERSTSTSGGSMADGTFACQTGGNLLIKYSGVAQTVDAWRAWLAEHNMTLYAAAAEATPENIPPAALAELQALHTYKPSTSWTASPWGGITYRADTKLYIDMAINGALGA